MEFRPAPLGRKEGLKLIFRDIRILPWFLAVLTFSIFYPLSYYYLEPRTLFFQVNDPTTGYPYSNTDTLPMWALLLSSIVVGCIVILVEFLCKVRYRPEVTHTLERFRNSIIWVLAYTESGLWAIFTCMWIQFFVGEYRPDFSARLAMFSPTTFNLIKNGHMGFPSPHSVICFYVGTFFCCYLWWLMFIRDQRYVRGRFAHERRGFLGYLIEDIVFTLRFLIPMIFLVLAALGSLSRFIIYRNFLWDIIAGALIGIFFALIAIFRTIYWYFPTPIKVAAPLKVAVKRLHDVEGPLPDFSTKPISPTSAAPIESRVLSG